MMKWKRKVHLEKGNNEKLKQVLGHGIRSFIARRTRFNSSSKVTAFAIS